MAGLMSVFSGDFEVSNKVSNVVITPLDEDGKIDEELGGAKILQYWPETLSESKSQNWQSKELPGLNIPLYQWVSGGERQFSYTANFTRDMDGVIGEDVEEGKHDVDIDAAIAWLYLLSSSDYEKTSDMTIAVAPPVLYMAFMGTELGYNLSTGASGTKNVGLSAQSAGGIPVSGIHCILTEVSVERTDWFPSGRPRKADVSLSFNEVIQIGNNILPYGREALKAKAELYTRRNSGKH